MNAKMPRGLPPPVRDVWRAVAPQLPHPLEDSDVQSFVQLCKLVVAVDAVEAEGDYKTAAGLRRDLLSWFKAFFLVPEARVRAKMPVKRVVKETAFDA